MTVSDFETFKTEFFGQLLKENKKCLKIIDDNSKVVEFYLNSKGITYVKIFVNDFNNVVLNPRFEKFKLLKDVLYHPLLTSVLSQFRESDVLIKACKRVNRRAIEWLLTMDMNLGVQDEFGRTVLLYAVKEPVLDIVVKKVMKSNEDIIHKVDNKGNNALFYATENMITFRNFLKYKDVFDFNYKNYDNENLLMYSCRYGNINSEEYFNYLCKFVKVDPYYVNIEGKTIAMYLAEHFKYRQLRSIVKEYNIDPNFKTKRGHTLVNCVIKKYYQTYIKKITDTKGFGLNFQFFKSALITFVTLVELGCDINEPIDEDGTTMTIILLKLRDGVTYNYLISKGAKEYPLLVEDNLNPYEKYPGVDITNPIIQENVKTSQKWLKQGLIDNNSPMLAKYSELINKNWFFNVI